MTAKHFTTLALSNSTKQVFQQQKKLNKKTEGTNNTKLYIWDGYDGHNCSMLCQVQLLPHFPPPLCFIHRPPHLCFIPICVLSVHSATLGLFHSCMPQHETEQSFQQLKIYHGHLVLTVKTPTLKTKKDNHNMFSFLFSVFTDSHLLVLTVVEWDDARCGYMINWWGENPNMFVRSVLKNVCILKIQFHNLLVYCYCPRWVLWWCLHSTMRVSLKTWQWHYWQSNIHYTPVVLWPSVKIVSLSFGKTDGWRTGSSHPVNHEQACRFLEAKHWCYYHFDDITRCSALVNMQLLRRK